MTMADEAVSSADTTLACMRGYAGCVQGAQEKGVIIGNGVYEPGKIDGHPAMQDAGGACPGGRVDHLRGRYRGVSVRRFHRGDGRRGGVGHALCPRLACRTS